MFNSQRIIRRISPLLIKQCENYGNHSLATSLGKFPASNRFIYTLKVNGSGSAVLANTHLQTTVCFQPSREYAARKGTRARKAAKKVKKIEVKQPFMFKKLAKLAE